MTEPVVFQAWWLFCATLVFLMIVGFLLLESGMIERRHVVGIATKNVAILFASSIAYGLWGYGLMFGETISGFCGNPFAIEDGYDVAAYRLYQTGFASVAATILSGAIAGRTTLFANVVIATIIAGIIYPIHGHWVWGVGGWLQSGHLTVHDFAGASCVHFIGGIAAYTACAKAGGRLPDQGLPDQDTMPHLSAAGVLVLMIGWIGFNGGSGIAPADPVVENGILFDKIAHYIQFTIHAAGAGAFAGFLIHACVARIRNPDEYLFSASHLLIGAMGGMVAITAICDYSSPVDALLVGFCGGSAAGATSLAMRHLTRLDDPVEAIAVHAGAGATGMLAVALVEPQHALAQCVDLICGAALTWCIVTAVLAFLGVGSRIVGINLYRVDETEQEQGLSFTEMKVPAGFNTFVLFAISIIAGVLVVAGVWSANGSVADKVVATSSIIVALPAMYGLWNYFRRLASAKNEPTGGESSKEGPSGQSGESDPDTPNGGQPEIAEMANKQDLLDSQDAPPTKRRRRKKKGE